MNACLYRSAFLSKSILSVTLATLCAAPLVLAQTTYKFDAATVSGLPARNIGSATMSGRITALDAVDQDGRITVFVGADGVGRAVLLIVAFGHLAHQLEGGFGDGLDDVDAGTTHPSTFILERFNKTHRPVSILY